MLICDMKNQAIKPITLPEICLKSPSASCFRLWMIHSSIFAHFPLIFTCCCNNKCDTIDTPANDVYAVHKAHSPVESHPNTKNTLIAKTAKLLQGALIAIVFTGILILLLCVLLMAWRLGGLKRAKQWWSTQRGVNQFNSQMPMCGRYGPPPPTTGPNLPWT